MNHCIHLLNNRTINTHKIKTPSIQGCPVSDYNRTMTLRQQQRMDGTYTNLQHRVQSIHWSNHATLKEICKQLPLISATFTKRTLKRRLRFAGHCCRAGRGRGGGGRGGSRGTIEYGACGARTTPSEFKEANGPCRSPGRGVLPSKRLLGMSHWMGSHFHNWVDYNRVTILVELLDMLEWGRTLSRFRG